MRRLVLTAALACAAVLVPAAPALAAAAFTIGTGQQPSIVADPATGTAHVVWIDSPVAKVAHYCRVPRGATACDIARTLDLGAILTSNPLFTADRPTILRQADGTLDVVMARYVAGDVVLWQSADGGATWAPAATKISSATIFGGSEPAILGPEAGKVSVPAWGTGTRRVISVRLDGFDNASVTKAEVGGFALPEGSYLYDFQIASAADGSVIAVANDLANAMWWRLPPGMNANVSANWSASGTQFGTGISPTRLAGGPGGAYVLLLQNGSPGYQAQVRAWNGAGFGSPVNVGASDANADSAITVGPSGAVGAAYRHGAGNQQALFALSTDAGASFSTPVVVTDDTTNLRAPRLALAQDTQGWVVFAGGPSSTDIRLASLLPLAQPTPAPSTPTTPAPTPAKPKTRKVTALVPGASISFGVPSQCVQPGSTFKVTLSWKRKKRKGNKFVKVTRADFYIGKKVVKVDRKVPFVQTLKVTAGARRGSTIELRARAFIKVKRGKGPKKSIKAKLKVCP